MQFIKKQRCEVDKEVVLGSGLEGFGLVYIIISMIIVITLYGPKMQMRSDARAGLTHMLIVTSIFQSLGYRTHEAYGLMFWNRICLVAPGGVIHFTTSTAVGAAGTMSTLISLCCRLGCATLALGRDISLLQLSSLRKSTRHHISQWSVCVRYVKMVRVT